MVKLWEALQSSWGATKHVEEPIAGTHTVSKANLSPGYYEDFKPDDPARRTNFDTSMQYSGLDPLGNIARFAGEDGWEPRK